MVCRFERYQPEYITISVPIFGGCTPIINVPIKLFQQISCLKGTEQAALKQFERLYEIEANSCQQPDYSEITDKLDEILERLGGTDPSNPNNPDYITITVPVVQANPDGTATEQTANISVHRLEADQVSALFRQIADIKTLENSSQRFSERSHNILGGNRWFNDQPENRTPSRLINVHQALRTRGRTDKNLESSGSDGEIFDEIFKVCEALTGYTFAKIGLEEFPLEVPTTLLGYSDKDKPKKIHDLGSFIEWFIQQFDGLIGKFPIEIEIEDSDPTQPGNQFKRIELPNISEALAETYALAISTSTNADLSINFLMRIAAEVISTKNAALITQDYARGNASFLGYKGNPVKREVDYAFNAQQMDHLDQLLSESKGYIQGWQEEDPETVVGFLQKIVFSAGIIKAVFFRNQKQLKQLQRELEAMTSQDKEVDEKDWKKFVDLINQLESPFYKGDSTNPVTDVPRPKIDNLSIPAPKEEKKENPPNQQQQQQ